MLNAEDELGDLQAYDDLAARLYGDVEMPPGTRELALALGWLNLRDPARLTTSETNTRRLRRLLGRANAGESRFTKLIAEDAPRYEKPRSWWAGNGSCEGPRMRPYRPRRPGPPTGTVDTAIILLGSSPQPPPPSDPEPLVCGVKGQIQIAERDMATGQIGIVHWFCRRHKEHADRVRRQLAARGDPPVPIPNIGGFLPRYFLEPALITLYTKCRPGWQPPIYGLCRDDWPTATPTLKPKRPRLALVAETADIVVRAQS